MSRRESLGVYTLELRKTHTKRVLAKTSRSVKSGDTNYVPERCLSKLAKLVVGHSQKPRVGGSRWRCSSRSCLQPNSVARKEGEGHGGPGPDGPAGSAQTTEHTRVSTLAERRKKTLARSESVFPSLSSAARVTRLLFGRFRRKTTGGST